MNFVIAVDLEGISGVVGTPNKGFKNDNIQYKFACEQALREVNQATKALYDCGAKKVYVWDNHGSSLNLDYMSLDKRVDILAGVGLKHRFSGLEDKKISGVLLIGYHAKANTSHAILAHTCDSSKYQYIKLNSKTVGEIEIDALLATANINAPVIFISSDNMGVSQGEKSLPWIKSVITKHSIGRNAGLLKHPSTVLDEIYSSVKDAYKNINNMKKYKIKSPITVEIRFLRLEDAQSVSNSKTKGISLIDPYTIKYTINKIMELY
ncbi:MAG: M55 family metallopeptidase [Clostridiales bacterium]|nr:M55 family metallopeptidase [Clostridiales bacterium]